MQILHHHQMQTLYYFIICCKSSLLFVASRHYLLSYLWLAAAILASALERIKSITKAVSTITQTVKLYYPHNWQQEQYLRVLSALEPSWDTPKRMIMVAFFCMSNRYVQDYIQLRRFKYSKRNEHLRNLRLHRSLARFWCCPLIPAGKTWCETWCGFLLP